MACQKDFGIVESLAVIVSVKCSVSLNKRDEKLIIRSEVVEPVLGDLVGVKVLKIVVARA
jgi:hypothetical protein